MTGTRHEKEPRIDEAGKRYPGWHFQETASGRPVATRRMDSRRQYIYALTAPRGWHSMITAEDWPDLFAQLDEQAEIARAAGFPDVA